MTRDQFLWNLNEKFKGEDKSDVFAALLFDPIELTGENIHQDFGQGRL